MKKLEFGRDISGFEATNAKIDIETMNEESYYDVLQNEMKQLLAETPAQGQMMFE